MRSDGYSAGLAPNLRLAGAFRTLCASHLLLSQANLISDYLDIIILCAAAVLAPYNSFKWMGCVICFVAMVGVAPIYFPMWGGLVCGPKKGATEEDYYFSEYTPAEREAGHHLASSAFVSFPSWLSYPEHLLG